MKKYLLYLTLASAVLLASCGNEGGDAAADANETIERPAMLANGTTELDLTKYYLSFSLIVPDSNRGYAEVVETGYGETIVRVGSVYNLIVAEGGDMAKKKTEIANDLMYVNTIVEEGDDWFIYKSQINDSFLDPEFHFYAVKDVNGRMYEFRDNKDEGPFAESIVRFMNESIRFIIPNQPAS